jgi:hypothetical protein
MKETIFKIFDTFTKGVDTYYHNGSMWLIFTDEQKWVIELAKDGILWYNSYFFGDCLKYVSLDVVENQHYITEWVENIIQNGVKSTKCDIANEKQSVEDTIQNGVKSTLIRPQARPLMVENTIQNGVKETTAMDENRDISQKDGFWWANPRTVNLENIIQNGIKELKGDGNEWVDEVREIIDKGIKETNHCSVSNDENAIMTLQSGVKVTKSLGPLEVTEKEINRVIKETHEDVYQSNARVWGVVNNGIKQTIELPDMSDETNGYGYYYERQKDKTYPHAYIVNDVINGK